MRKQRNSSQSLIRRSHACQMVRENGYGFLGIAMRRPCLRAIQRSSSCSIMRPAGHASSKGVSRVPGLGWHRHSGAGQPKPGPMGPGAHRRECRRHQAHRGKDGSRELSAGFRFPLLAAPSKSVVVGWLGCCWNQCRQRIRVGVSPRGRGNTQGFYPLKIVDDVAVVQHAASEPSLCPQGDHAAEKRADDGRREQGLRFGC
jgi:hypothetical protein